MKKILSVILSAAVCTGMLTLLASCGSNVSKSEYDAVEDAFSDSYLGQNVDKENISKFTVDDETADKDSDNYIYNDETDNTGFIYNRETKEAVSTGYIVRNALYRDIDGDGYEEVYTTGFVEKTNKTLVSLYDDTESLIPGENDDSVLELIARADFTGDLNLGFFVDDDGNVHVAAVDTTTGEVTTDYGIAKQNGLTLEVGDYINYSAESDDFDKSVFVTGDYTFKYNGKEFTPSEDFAFGEAGIVPPVEYIAKDEFEKLIGQSYKSLGDDLDSRAIMVINGKEYVSWYTLTLNYNIERELSSEGGKDYIVFTDVTETTTAK